MDNLPGIYSERVFILNNGASLYPLDQLPNYPSKSTKQAQLGVCRANSCRD